MHAVWSVQSSSSSSRRQNELHNDCPLPDRRRGCVSACDVQTGVKGVIFEDLLFEEVSANELIQVQIGRLLLIWEGVCENFEFTMMLQQSAYQGMGTKNADKVFMH